MESTDRYWYHATLAPEGRLFQAGTADPSEAGWVTTPAAFDPAYVAPPPDPPEMRPIPGLPALPPREVYPSWRYHATEPALIVASAAEDAALGDGWYHSPADVPVLTPVPVAAAPLSETAAARRADLYAGTVPDLVARIAKIDDRATLDLWRSYEDQNPKGARKGVITALTTRLAALVTPEEE